MRQLIKQVDIWVILGLLILLIAVAIFSQSYISYSAAQVAENFPKIADTIEQEDWPQARALFSHSHQRWQQVLKIWQMLINHNDMWNVEVSFADMQVLLQQEDGPRAAQEIANLRYYLQHVPQNEVLNWQNIL